MSTKITDIHVALVALMAATFTSHKQLQNVDDIDQNPSTLLRLGWGVKIGPGRNTSRQICPKYAMVRTFTIFLTQEAIAKDSDAARRESAKVALLEQFHTLFAAAEANQQLGAASVSFVYADDGGPEELLVDDKWYIVAEANFNIEYFQQVP